MHTTIMKAASGSLSTDGAGGSGSAAVDDAGSKAASQSLGALTDTQDGEHTVRAVLCRYSCRATTISILDCCVGLFMMRAPRSLG